jgi:hypothetical protein
MSFAEGYQQKAAFGRMTHDDLPAFLFRVVYLRPKVCLSHGVPNPRPSDALTERYVRHRGSLSVSSEAG